MADGERTLQRFPSIADIELGSYFGWLHCKV